MLALGAALVAGCKRKQEAAPAPSEQASQRVPIAGQLTSADKVKKGHVLAPRATFQLAVFHLKKPKLDVEKELRRLAAEKKLEVHLDSEPEPQAGQGVRFGSPPIADYAPPDIESLQYYGEGLSEQEGKDLQSAHSVTTLSFYSAGSDATATYRAALELTRDLAKSAGGLAWDEESREVFSAEAWEARITSFEGPIPDVQKHIAIHMYRDGELMRAVTLGMGKFALPDVVVNETPSNGQDSLVNLINLTCQTLVEKRDLVGDGDLHVSIDNVAHKAHRERLLEDLDKDAKRQAHVLLTVAKKEEGDAENQLIEIAFPGTKSGLQERQDALISALFGSSDEIVEVEHSPELLAASARAKKELEKIAPRYAKKPPERETLLVKGPFAAPDGRSEWMWVEVVRFKGDTYEGILQNDPFWIPNLKSGARVEVKADSVFDYILTLPDGSQKGNETAELLEKHAK